MGKMKDIDVEVQEKTKDYEDYIRTKLILNQMIEEGVGNVERRFEIALQIYTDYLKEKESK